MVENLLLLQCEDRLASPLCGHLESSQSPPQDAEKVQKGTVVIHHTIIVVVEDMPLLP